MKKLTTRELRSSLENNNIRTMVLDRLPEALKHDYAEAAYNMVTLFPALRGTFRGIYNGLRHPGVFAGTTFSGEIELNVSRMKTIKQVKEDYALDVKRAFHPAGTTVANIIVHELGHVLELVLIKKRYTTEREQKAAWNKSTIAGEIVKAALDHIGCDVKKNPVDAAMEIRRISGYAGENPSETLAEAVSDWYSNGAMLAAPLSIAIVEEITARL